MFKFFSPQNASVNSKASPIKKDIDGIPSINKLIIRPIAKPVIKNTFAIVAVLQRRGLTVPVSQSPAILIYKPIVALNTSFKSVDSTLKSKINGKVVFGNSPYVKAIIVVAIVEISRCKFFLFVGI